MHFELVIFDCDGVLVDSEPRSNAVLAELLGEIGLPTPYEEVLSVYKGRSWATCLALIEERLGTPPPASLSRRFRERVLADLRQHLGPVRGIEHALDRIEVATCVASSSDPERLRASLAVTDLLDRFEGRLFSATQVRRGKPAPDLFLFAARELRARPERCAVIEDSPIGIEAAFAAGMTPFGFCGTETADARALAASGARVFDDMRALPELLAAGAPA